MNYVPRIRLRVLPALLPTDGRNIELQATDTYIQWRYEGDTEWTDLVPLSDITGPTGPNIELQQDGTNIEWRAVGDVDWNVLVPLSAITGPPGPEGPQGAAGLGLTVAADRTFLAAVDGTLNPTVNLLEEGRQGLFDWNGDDLSSEMVIRTVTSFAVDSSTETISMRTATTTAVSPGRSSTVTMTIDAPCVVSWVGHGLSAGNVVIFTTTGSLPTGLSAGTPYYVASSGLATDSFQVSATRGGASITTTGSQSGTHTAGAHYMGVKAGHGFTADEEVYVTTTVNGLITNGRYFIYFDSDTAAASGGNTDNFKLRTSLTASAFDLTGTTNFTVKANHNLLTGNAVYSASAVNGISADTIYYVIRTDANAFKLATTYALAHAGTAVNLTGTSAMTLKHLADPLQGIFVPPTGGALDGSDGAWVRQKADRVNHRYLGATGDGVTDDAHALQAGVWLGFYLNRPIYTPAGVYMTSLPIKHETNDWINGPNQTIPYSRMQAPDNGIVWRGDGREKSIIKMMSTFPNSTYLLTLDGNMKGLTQLVGSRPLAQGYNSISDLQLYGRGRLVGTNNHLLYLRAQWGGDVADMDFREASGDFITIGSGAPAGPPNYDEVDNTAYFFIERNRFFEGGKSAITGYSVRAAALRIRGNEFRYFADWGINFTPAYCEVSGNVFEGCGNRDDTTTGAIRVTDSLSGSEARTLAILRNVFEYNFNFDIDLLQCRGARIVGNSFHTILPTGGVVANKASVKLRATGATTTRDIIFEGNRWPDYAAPSDGSSYDVPRISIASSVTGVTVLPNIAEGTATFVAAASAVRLYLINIPTDYTVTLTGTAAVDSFRNGKSLGTITAAEWGYTPKTSFTPVVSGLSTAGSGTYSTQTGRYERQGSVVKFSITVTMSAHTGTGDMVVSLPVAATENAVVSLAYSNLAYTNAPFAEIVGSETRVRIRQAASDGTVSGVPIDGAATLKISGEYFVA